MYKNLKLTLAVCAGLLVATAAVCAATEYVAGLFGVELEPQATLDVILKLRGADLVKGCLMVVAFAPLSEELLFRGLLFRLPALKARRAALAAAIAVASSALFSFAHYVDYAVLVRSGAFATTPPNNAFAALFLFGLAQCWLYRRTKAIWCPMLSHALFNATTVALLFAFPELAKG